MFKVNDIITGENGEKYTITNDESLCRVVRVYSETEMRVEIIGMSDSRYSFYLGKEFGVNQEFFVPCTKESFAEEYPYAVFGEDESEGKTMVAMNPKDKNTITEEEKQKLVDEMYELLLNDYDCYRNVSKDALRKIVDEWAEQKGWIIQLFKKHPNYNGNYQILFDTDYEREIDSSQVYDFFAWLKTQMWNYADEAKIDGMLESEFLEAYDPEYKLWNAIRYILNDKPDAKITVDGRTGNEICENFEVLERKYKEFKAGTRAIMGHRVEGDSMEEKFYNLFANFQQQLAEVSAPLATEWVANTTNTYFPDAKVVAGQKTSRIVNRVCTMFGINKDPDYNRRFAVFADAVNPLKIKRHTVLSVHPIDYLLMSNGNSWHSCHTIDLDQYSGEYSSGTVSYMLDPSTFVFYTVDKSQTAEHIELKKKVNRCMFHMGQEKLIQGRVYPQSTDGATHVYKNFREIVQKVIAECLDVPNLWKNIKGTDICQEMIDTRGTHYPDYEYNSCCNVSFLTGLTEMRNECDIVVGHTPICIACGDEHTHDHIYCRGCEEDAHGYYCEECGEFLEEDEVIWVNDTPYCSDCVFWCEYHQQYEVKENTTVYTLDNGNEICEDAYDEGTYARCERCEDDFDYENAGTVFTDDDVWYCCADCATADGYIYTERYGWTMKNELVMCPTCGEMVKKEDYDEEHRCCVNCEEVE